jgi:integrase
LVEKREQLTLACSLEICNSESHDPLGRKWGYATPSVEKRDIVFPADKKSQPQIFFFDADTAARVINVAAYPYKLMLLIAAVCGLRIGEVTALKVSSLDFRRKLIHVTAALD